MSDVVVAADRPAGAPAAGAGHAPTGLAASDAYQRAAAALAAATERPACNLCGADDHTVIAELDRYGLPVRIVQCACGLRFQSPRLNAAQYAEFYRDTYRPLVAAREAQHGRTYTATTIEADQWSYAAQVSNLMAPTMATRRFTTVLDVGGSTGAVGRMFKARWGCDVTVIDPCLDELMQALGCAGLCATAEEADFPTADLALVCRSLDHFRDPMGVLRRLRDRVPRLYVDAADVNRWPPAGRYKVDHPYAFTGKTLMALVQAAGWRIEQTWTRRDGLYVGLECS
jgi:SAM-dependent methyltransferase